MNYGYCGKCSSELVPIFFIEEERNFNVKTGRKRKAVSHLLCECCGREYIVDNSQDGHGIEINICLFLNYKHF